MLERLAGARIEPIVVGVHNVGADRLAEYSPFPDRRHGGGDADRIWPFSRRRSSRASIGRSAPSRERDATAMLGSSMGGLVSLYVLFRYPRVFGAAGVMSPSIWFGQRRIFDAIGDVRSGASRSANPQRIYIDMGTEEGSVALRDARAMADRLERAGYRAGQSLLWVEESGGRHTEQDWSRRLGRAIRFLLPATEAGRA